MFGEVRSILQQPPSTEAWEELCQLVSDWNAPERDEQVLPYIHAHLGGWPDHMRTTPLRWREGLVRGANLPFASMVRVLDASEMGLKNEDMWTLARSPVMKHITGLDLRGNKIGWRGMNHLFEGPEAPAPHLVSLDLSETAIGGEGVRLLARTSALPRLTSLSLRNLGLSHNAIEVLGASETLTSLRALDLGHDNLGEGHIEALAQGELFARLTTLSLDHNPLGPRGGLRLVRRASIGHLEALSLCHCALPSPIIEAMARRESLSKCHTLRLSHNSGLSALPRVAASSVLPSLEVLEVSGERLSRDALLAVIKSESLSSLRTIAAHPDSIDEGLQLAASARTREVIAAPVPVYQGLCKAWC